MFRGACFVSKTFCTAGFFDAFCNKEFLKKFFIVAHCNKKISTCGEKFFYLPQPTERPPLQNSNATTKIKQQGFMLRLKVFIFPPQQHKNRIISKIQVQLHPPRQPPFSPQPPQSPSLNIPLNIFYLLFAEVFRHYFDLVKSTSQYGIFQKCVTVVG